MPLTIDNKGLLSGIDRLLKTIDQAQDDGLDAGAALLQAVDQSTTAYRGMSGATRDSTMAARMGPGYDAKAGAAYSAAQAALSGFTGHAGQAVSQDSGVTLAAGEKGALLTNFTDYADKLEIENAGEKAHIGPTISAEGPEVTRIIANFSKRALG
jgi:hypothetical protein